MRKAGQYGQDAPSASSDAPLRLALHMRRRLATHAIRPNMASVLLAAETATLAAERHCSATKRPRAPRQSVTQSMDTAAEQLWSAKTRNFFEFEPIEPTNENFPSVALAWRPAQRAGLPSKLYSYLKQPAAVARLQVEGFERANRGAPHPWFLISKPGVVSPAEKALCRSLTSQRSARGSRPTASPRTNAAGCATSAIR